MIQKKTPQNLPSDSDETQESQGSSRGGIFDIRSDNSVDFSLEHGT